MAWLNARHLPLVLEGRISTTPAVSPASFPAQGSTSPGGHYAAEGSKARTRRLTPWRLGSAPSCDRHSRLLFMWRQKQSANGRRVCEIQTPAGCTIRGSRAFGHPGAQPGFKASTSCLGPSRFVPDGPTEKGTGRQKGQMGNRGPNRGNGCRADGMTGPQPVGRGPGWHFPSREGISIHFMAQRIQTLLIDDLDGGEAAGTVRFGLDGAEYEIDLSAAHNDELRKALQQYLAHARRTGGAARSAARTRRGRRRRHRQGPRVGQRAGHRRQGPRPRPGQRRRAIPDGRRSVTPNGRPHIAACGPWSPKSSRCPATESDVSGHPPGPPPSATTAIQRKSRIPSASRNRISPNGTLRRRLKGSASGQDDSRSFSVEFPSFNPGAPCGRSAAVLGFARFIVSCSRQCALPAGACERAGGT